MKENIAGNRRNAEKYFERYYMKKKLILLCAIVLLCIAAVAVYLIRKSKIAGNNIIQYPGVQSTLTPSTVNRDGFIAGYVFIPIDGNIYRYDYNMPYNGGYTKDSLLYTATDNSDPDNPKVWKFYTLAEFPDINRILCVENKAGFTGKKKYIYDHLPPTCVLEEDIEDAKNAGFVIEDDAEIGNGELRWQEFYEKTQRGEAAVINFGKVFRVDYSSLSEELKITSKDDYPSLYLSRLTYDGTSFLLQPVHKINGEYVVYEEKGVDLPEKTYLYLRELKCGAPTEYATFTYEHSYVLVDDNTTPMDVLDREVLRRMVSSDSAVALDFIPYYKVYSEYVWKKNQIN